MYSLDHRLNTEVSEQLYFSIDQPFSSDFKPKFCVRETSEAAAGALKCMEKSQLKGMKIEKEETVKKASTRANKRAKKKKVRNFLLVGFRLIFVWLFVRKRLPNHFVAFPASAAH